MMNPQLMSAIGNNASAFSNLAATRPAERGVEGAAGVQRAVARRIGGGGGPAQCRRVAGILANPQAFAAMLGNPEAFAAVSKNAAAMATLAAQPKALSALAAQPNLAALMANPSFSAALNQAGVSQSTQRLTRRSGGRNGG